MATTHLVKAKVRKNDEYYTPYETVQTEIENYLKGQPDLFKDAVVYLPADNPYLAQSAFYCYFKNNFFRLKLKKLISVGYNAASNGIQSYGFVYTLTRDNESGSSFTEHSYLLEGSGDFQSHECRAFWEEATHVITNPPFSKIKDFIEYCVHFGVFYSFITPIINLQYRRLFQLIWKQLAWLGTTETNTFLTQNPDKPTEIVARPIVHCVWFTNIYHNIPLPKLPTLHTLAYNQKHQAQKLANKKGYRKYDNYDALNVPYLDCIPTDYTGKMGVPLTILRYITPPQHLKLEDLKTLRAYQLIANTLLDRNSESFQWLSKKLGHFSDWGLADSQNAPIPRNIKDRKTYYGPVIDGKAIFTRIIIQWQPTNLLNLINHIKHHIPPSECHFTKPPYKPTINTTSQLSTPQASYKNRADTPSIISQLKPFSRERERERESSY